MSEEVGKKRPLETEDAVSEEADDAKRRKVDEPVKSEESSVSVPETESLREEADSESKTSGADAVASASPKPEGVAAVAPAGASEEKTGEDVSMSEKDAGDGKEQSELVEKTGGEESSALKDSLPGAEGDGGVDDAEGKDTELDGSKKGEGLESKTEEEVKKPEDDSDKSEGGVVETKVVGKTEDGGRKTDDGSKTEEEVSEKEGEVSRKEEVSNKEGGVTQAEEEVSRTEEDASKTQVKVEEDGVGKGREKGEEPGSKPAPVVANIKTEPETSPVVNCNGVDYSKAAAVKEEERLGQAAKSGSDDAAESATVKSEGSEKENFGQDRPSGEDVIMLSDEEDESGRGEGKTLRPHSDVLKKIKALQNELRNEEATLVLLKKLRQSQTTQSQEPPPQPPAPKAPAHHPPQVPQHVRQQHSGPPPLVRGSQAAAPKALHNLNQNIHMRGQQLNSHSRSQQGPPPLVMASRAGNGPAVPPQQQQQHHGSRANVPQNLPRNSMNNRNQQQLQQLQQQHQQQQQQQQNGEGDTSSDQPRRSSSEKENICEMASKQSPGSKSPGKSSKSKTKSKKSEKQQQYAQGVEEEMSQSQQSPVLMEQRELEPLTPLVINENQDISMDQHRPQATSTPAANGQFRSPPLSPDSGTDQSDDEAFSPSDHQLHSPSMSLNSTSTGTGSLRFSRTQSDSIDSRRSEPNFGRFYNTSYLGMGKPGDSYLKRGGATASPQSSRPKPAGGSHFHRPPNFTYSKDPPDFLKKKASGMSALATTKRVVKVRRSSSPADLRTQEPIRMSMFPSAKPKLANELDKIERDDWPGPASPAALLPEILRQRRRSKGEKDDDNDEDEVVENPKIKRELEEISKIKDESGIGRVIYKELEEQKAKPRQPLDPWKASRAPSAKFEPRYRTRFQSPMFASPSRFLDRPRYAWDDSDIRTYRSVSTLANLPTPKPGYGPSYMTPRAATLPLAGAYGARVDFRYFDFGEDDDRPEPSTHTSSSTLTGDTSSRRHDSSYYEGPSISLLKLQKNTWHTEAEPTIYPYEQLKITNFDLPKDVDTNKLEIHLAHDDFEKLFNMPKESFYRMAEWKRNDIKRKLHLY
ncbi:nucleolar protein dao-5 [Aplysia californica]|uniref:Nucleolar protein dao-5 n=1 Tax=Aplysia californica TaxID=6500 RepID=A0ABM0JU20_APLCA|nr:nucleolar protein dao-5 [Aplysia californica]